MAIYSTLIYHGSAGNSANATSYQFTSRDIGVARSTRAVHVVVTYYGTNVIPTLGVDVNGVTLQQRVLQHNQASSYSGVAHFSEFVPTGSSVTITVTANVTLQNCAITWFTFDARSLSVIGSATTTSTGTTVVSPTFTTTGNGIAFAGVSSTGTTSGVTYTGATNGTLTVAQSNSTIESLLSYAVSYVKTDDDSTTGRITYSGSSNAYRSLAVCAYGPDKLPQQYKVSTPTDTFSLTSPVTQDIVYSQFEYVGFTQAPYTTTIKTVTLSNVSLGSTHHKRAILAIVVMRPTANLDSITASSCTLNGSAMTIVKSGGSGLYSSSGCTAFILRETTSTTADFTITTSHNFKALGLLIFKFSPATLDVIDSFVTAANTGSITALDLEVAKRGIAFAINIGPQYSSQSISWTDTLDSFQFQTDQIQFDFVDTNKYSVTVATLKSTAASTLNDSVWATSGFTGRLSMWFSFGANYVPQMAGIFEMPAIVETFPPPQWYASTTLTDPCYLYSPANLNWRLQLSLNEAIDLLNILDVRYSTDIFEHVALSETTTRIRKGPKEVIAYFTVAEALARKATYRKQSSENMTFSEDPTARASARITEYPKFSDSPKTAWSLRRSELALIRDWPRFVPICKLAQSFDVAGSSDYAYRPRITIQEKLGNKDLLAAQAFLKYGFSDSAKIVGRLLSRQPAFVDNTINIAAVISLVRAYRIIEKLRIPHFIDPDLIYGLSLTDSIKLSDSLRRFVAGTISADFGMQSVTLPNVRSRQSLVDNVNIHQTAGHSFILNVKTNSTFSFNDFNVLQFLFKPTIKQDIAIYAAYVSPNNTFTTWAVNTRTGATTEYNNFDFNSFASRNHKYLAASDQGLFELQGDTDDGEDIISQLRSGFAQFGSSRFTSFKGAYLGVRGGGEYFLKLITGDDKEYLYTVNAQDMRTTKIRFGKGLRSRYFAFELISTGQDFDLDSVEFIPLVAQRRV